MNIFYLHEDPKICAEQHLDKHCSKMLVEYAQLMSTAHRIIDGVAYEGRTKTGRRIKRWKHPTKDNLLYLACHVNHPSAVWCRENAYNYNWLYKMWSHLHDQFVLRYNNTHLSYTLLKDALRNPPRNIALNKQFTQPTQAMPDDVKHKDSITAYRNYYIQYKHSFAKWKLGIIPEWYVEGVVYD
jgi:hypothetical protein